MITVKFLKPFYTKIFGKKLRLVFAYQYFSIVKDDETYWFVPVEGKEMIFNLDNLCVENLSEVFVFQKGNKFIRLPLYQLLLVSNVQDYLTPILEKVVEETGESVNVKPIDEQDVLDDELKTQVINFINQCELNNINKLIDKALMERNEEAFYKLSKYKNERFKKQ